jgi:HD-GYP domain-containing protein (c-di-GMP phosphodiesterase class II)
MQTSELTRLRHAALVHDVGKVAIPVTILAKGERRSSSEWEIYRLHPYYTQQILERATALQDLAQAAAAHHEWINGQGYHRQLRGEQIPLHGRILAVANSYTRLLHQQGDQTDQREILRQMSSLVGTQFDSVCYEALVTSMIQENGLKRSLLRPRHVSNLTDREVEVLSLLAQGYTNPQIARILYLSRKTIEHHLPHIYTKIGVMSRTAAVVYAVQQGLV